MCTDTIDEYVHFKIDDDVIQTEIDQPSPSGTYQKRKKYTTVAWPLDHDLVSDSLLVVLSPINSSCILFKILR